MGCANSSAAGQPLQLRRERTPPPRKPTSPLRKPNPTSREHTPPPKAYKRKRDNGSIGYQQNDIGLFECVPFDFRSNPEEMDRPFSNPPDQLPFVDKDFAPKVAIKGESVEWKRPHEFRKAPVLFSEGTTRYDIGQGGAGTCWFLSIVAMLADKPKLLNRVVPLNAWNSEGGYFFCHFWRFGEWETVFIDDFLPTIHGNELWGARSAEDDQEMWPAFLEKAFARFHGNYDILDGGHSGDAFLALTGGCSEIVSFDEALEADADGSTKTKSLALHNRLEHAIRHGESMITTEVPKKYHGKYGLVGDHAFSLTDAAIVNSNGKNVHLVRVRNPWGNTEWTGPWSDKSPKWKTVEANSVPYVNKDDGEFWISLIDFIKYFSSVTICSVIPDIDRDGCPDSLNHCTAIYGEWIGETATGFEDKTGNPRYMFEVTDKGRDDDGLIPIVLQLCQKLKHRKCEKFPIRVDLFKVIRETSGPEPLAVLVLLGEVIKVTNDYPMDRQMISRFKVKPGLYAAVPSCLNAGMEREFLVRIYSASPIYNVREIGREYAILESDEFKCPDEAVDINYCTTINGEWIGETATGFEDKTGNPRYMFEVADKGKGDDGLIPIVLQLCQKLKHRKCEIFPIRVDLYEVLGETSGPEPLAVLVLLEEVIKVPYDYPIDRHMISRFKVKPGLYAAVPSCLDAGMEREFLVRIYSASPIYNVREIGREYTILESEVFKCPDEAVEITHTEIVFGKWTCGRNAGGNVSCDAYYKNPQIEFEIPNRNKEEFVAFTIIQVNSDPLYPIALRLYTMDRNCNIAGSSEHLDYLYEKHDECPLTLAGEAGSYMYGHSAEIQHKLPPGKYLTMCHLDDDASAQENRFAVIIRSSCKIRTKQHRMW